MQMRPPANRTARILAIVIGLIVALGGLLLAGVGVALLGLFGSDGKAESGTHRFASANAALVASIDDIRDIKSATDVIGEPRLDLAVRSPRRAFVGGGPARQVDRYLASSPIDRVTDFDVDPFKLVKHRRDGSKRPSPPATQRFWVARASGRKAALSWKLRDGDYRVVVMNADGSRPVATVGEAELTLPHVGRTAWIMAAIGLVLAIVGVAVAGMGGRTRAPKPAQRRRKAPKPAR
jgi:hypothetical protein